jgi:FkbM family methyltransferase
VARDILGRTRARLLVRAARKHANHLNHLTERRVDAVVTFNEVNDRHGTGVLVQRLIGGRRDIISLRAHDHYGGEHLLPGPQFVVPHSAVSRADVYRWTLEATAGVHVGWVLCVPFGEADVTAALALSDAHGAQLCIYVMDDANVEGAGIPDDVLAEAFAKARIRFAISSDLRDAYEAKYGHRVWLLPPTLPPGVVPAPPRRSTRARGVVVGNVWGRTWLQALRETVRESGITVDWYPTATRAGWLDLAPNSLAADGIRLLEPLPEAELADRLRDYEVSLLPSAPELGGENHGIAALSLPSRITSLIGASEIPTIVLGDPDSCAARFVRCFGLGASCPYRGDALLEAMDRLATPDARAELQLAIAQVREILEVDDLPGWLASAIATGRPPTRQFEALTVDPPRGLRGFLDDTPPLGPWMRNFDALHAALGRLADAGVRPSFVLDGGSSTGVWSDVVARTFPNARFVLVDPIEDLYDGTAVAAYRARLPDAVHVKAALGSTEGSAELHLDRGLYGSSVHVDNVEVAAATATTVPVTTLDAIAETTGLTPGGLLKLDLQGAELEALEGGTRFLELVDVIIVEVTLAASNAFPPWRRIDDWMAANGFTVWDQAGDWRDPRTGRMLQMDIVYVRETLVG